MIIFGSFPLVFASDFTNNICTMLFKLITQYVFTYNHANKQKVQKQNITGWRTLKGQRVNYRGRRDSELQGGQCYALNMYNSLASRAVLVCFPNVSTSGNYKQDDHYNRIRVDCRSSCIARNNNMHAIKHNRYW
jgi:hypothetical protein